MKDASREEAIEWCICNRVDFTKPKFPPPAGWMWAENEGVAVNTLTAIFTNTEDEDIDEVDLLFKLAARGA